MKNNGIKILFVFIVFLTTCFLLWGVATVFYPSKHPVEESAEKFDIHYALSIKPPFIFKYYLYKPYKYDKAKEYPLILMLHGSSRHMRGAVHASSYKVQKKHPMFVVVPVAPPLTIWARPKAFKPESYSLAKLSVSKVIKKYSIDTKRIYVTGYSMGGAGTYGMVHHYPNLFAAAIPLCGYWSDDIHDYREITKAGIPIKIHHGTRDQYVDYKHSKSSYYSLRTLNNDVEFISHQKSNHNIWEKVYKDMAFWDWLNQQSKS
jgi:predicted peptidase